MNTVSQAEYVAQTNAAYETSGAKKKPANYGRTIGNPQLSEEGQKYYEELKKKYSNMDFILVSKDMKETAKAQAGSYANPNRLVVLVDEEKIERMATDENFRRQYEGIIANAAVKLPQMQKSVGSNPAVKGFGMQINDGGNASFFAVVDKSLAMQRERIQKNREKKAEEKKAEAKKDAKTAAEEKLKEKHAGKAEDEDLVTVTASSIDELIRKINDITYGAAIRTDFERARGQHRDFRW